MSDTMVRVHPFELAGLGKAPFHVTGCDELRGPITLDDGSQVGAQGQPMGCCKYCGTGIAIRFWVASSDGNAFTVGCECVKHTNDKTMITKVQSIQRERARQKRRERDIARAAQALEWLKQQDVIDLLSSQPHPNEYLAGQGRTRLGWAEYCVKHGGVQAVYEYLKEVKA